MVPLTHARVVGTSLGKIVARQLADFRIIWVRLDLEHHEW